MIDDKPVIGQVRFGPMTDPQPRVDLQLPPVIDATAWAADRRVQDNRAADQARILDMQIQLNEALNSLRDSLTTVQVDEYLATARARDWTNAPRGRKGPIMADLIDRDAVLKILRENGVRVGSTVNAYHDVATLPAAHMGVTVDDIHDALDDVHDKDVTLRDYADAVHKMLQSRGAFPAPTLGDALELVEENLLAAIDAKIEQWQEDDDLADWVSPAKTIRAEVVAALAALQKKGDA